MSSGLFKLLDQSHYIKSIVDLGDGVSPLGQRSFIAAVAPRLGTPRMPDDVSDNLFRHAFVAQLSNYRVTKNMS